MKYLIIILSLVIMGCGNVKAHLDQLPNIAFDKVKYQRNGMVSTALIQAEGARVEDGILYIDNVEISENTPWFSLYFMMNNYSRKIEDNE